jgi:hypothetical protein
MSKGRSPSKTIRGKVDEYIKYQYHKEDLSLEELDFTFISNFERFLKVQAGIEHNTVMVTSKGSNVS